MKTLIKLTLLVAAIGFASVAHAGGVYRLHRSCETPAVYVPAYPVVYVQPCAPVYRPARACYQAPLARYPVRAPRMIAQPGYWVQQDLGCGRSRRLWQPSRAVSVMPDRSTVLIARW